MTDDFAAVIDGSTSKVAHQLNPSMRNGQLAMAVLTDVVKALPANASLDLFCRQATQRIANIYSQHAISRQLLMDHPEERLTASIAIYSHHHGEIWMVGDCQCLVDGTYYENPKPDESRIAHERAAIIRQMLDSGSTDIAALQHHDLGRDRIVGKIVATCHDQNVRFAVCDGFDIAMDQVKTIPVSWGSEVVMATDGYPFLRGTLAASEKALADLLAADPLCIIHHIATKGLMEGNQSFDDRAYIRFKVE